ncbi:structure-specific endonuclease subunit EME2 [Pelodytes ibericus]
MEEGQTNIASQSSVLSPRKLYKRATTWAISDSENEEESKTVQREDQPGLVSKTETVEITSVVLDQGQLPNVETNAPVLEIPSSHSTTPSPLKKTRKRRGAEDLEAKKVETEERKKHREEKKQDKERKKELEKLEKESRKQAALAVKLLRPEHCVKYMTIHLDAGLLEDSGSEVVLEALRSSDYQYIIEPHSVPQSITWRRVMPSDWTCIDGLEIKLGEEDHMLVVVQPKDFLASVSCFTRTSKYSSIGDQSIETMASIFGISNQYRERKTTLVVMGLEDYRWCHRLSKKMERQSLHHREERGTNESSVARKQIQEALVFLQLYFEMEVACLDNWKELGHYVCATTKSLAQRPFRKHWDSETFSFCTSAGTWKGWGSRGTLTGLPLSWKRQIQQFNRVSAAMAGAVTEAYPSPQLLMKAYEECSTEREKIALLSDLRVPQGQDTDDIPGEDHAPGKDRRIGPDISRRIWLFMTSLNPELVLDLNS